MSVKTRLFILLTGTALSSLAATTCVQGTFAQYLNAGFTCQTDNRVFSNFLFSSSPSNLLTASQIQVQPLSNGGFFFPFPSNFTISSAPDGSPVTLNFMIGYEAKAVNNQQFNSLQFDFNGGGFNKGLASLATNFCIGHVITGCPTGQGGQSVLSLAANGVGKSTDTIIFPAGTQDLFLSFNGTLNTGVQGTANFIQLEDMLPTGPVSGVSGVPEPSTVLSAGFSLLVAVVLRCRFVPK